MTATKDEIPTATGKDEIPACPLLLVGSYLRSQGMPQYMVRRMSAKLGQVLRQEYYLRHGRMPPTTERMIGGQPRRVFVYTEADRNLFDLAYLRL